MRERDAGQPEDLQTQCRGGSVQGEGARRGDPCIPPKSWVSTTGAGGYGAWLYGLAGPPSRNLLLPLHREAADGRAAWSLEGGSVLVTVDGMLIALQWREADRWPDRLQGAMRGDGMSGYCIEAAAATNHLKTPFWHSRIPLGAPSRQPSKHVRMKWRLQSMSQLHMKRGDMKCGHGIKCGHQRHAAHYCNGPPMLTVPLV